MTNPVLASVPSDCADKDVTFWLPAPTSHAQAVALIFGALNGFDGIDFGDLSRFERRFVLAVWSACARWLVVPSERAIVKHNRVDLSAFRSGHTNTDTRVAATA